MVQYRRATLCKLKKKNKKEKKHQCGKFEGEEWTRVMKNPLFVVMVHYYSLFIKKIQKEEKVDETSIVKNEFKKKKRPFPQLQQRREGNTNWPRSRGRSHVWELMHRRRTCGSFRWSNNFLKRNYETSPKKIAKGIKTKTTEDEKIEDIMVKN